MCVCSFPLIIDFQAQEALSATSASGNDLTYTLPGPVHIEAVGIFTSRCYGVTFEQVKSRVAKHKQEKLQASYTCLPSTYF